MRFITVLVMSAISLPVCAATIYSPTKNQNVTSPFAVVVSSPTCNGVNTSASGFSIDNSPNTIVEPSSFKALAIAGVGPHTVHIKCWGAGTSHDIPVNITVVNGASSVLSNFTSSVNLENNDNWVGIHDAGTPGSASGETKIVNNPSMSGSARRFSYSYSYYGGERWHLSFANDVNATHFVYDTFIYLDSTASNLANIELDMNQVTADGNTVVYGVQCDGWSGAWEYTVAAHNGTKWVRSNVACPAPYTWKQNVWHHIQISYYRDTYGVVTYNNIVVDGDGYDFINAKGYSSFPLGWGKVLLTNFQLDGRNSSNGNVNAWVDNLTIYRW